MNKQDKSGFSWRVLGYIAVIPLTYVLSFGPVLGLLKNSPHRNRVAWFYQPVVWLSEVPGLERPITAYARFWGVIASGADWHTSPDKWKKPRLFHCPFEPEFAGRITVDHCGISARLPERQFAPNQAYWFARIDPDRTKAGPWNTEVLVHTERDYLVRIGLRDIHDCRDIAWVNEKLLRIRVWWGRVCATDLIVDVERESILYREMVWDGVIPFQQYLDAKQQDSQPPRQPKRRQPLRLRMPDLLPVSLVFGRRSVR